MLSVLAVTGLLASVVFAAETTGSISGIVKGRDGAPLPGVTVTVSGPYLPAGRTDYTDSAGRFQFARLLPGEYVVKASLEKLGSWQRSAIVAVGKDTQLDAMLETRTTEAIEVSAALPLVDLKSTEVAQNFTREQFEKLPMGRTYKDLFQLSPGVADNPNRINVNAGGNREDNLFLYDGVNITNPFYADIVTNFTQLDIQEINIKQGAVTAEFGRTGGFVVNAITKSGTNQFHGEVGGDLQKKSFSANYSNGTLGSTTDRYAGGVGLGGPIFKDFVWFYGSGSLVRSTAGDRTNNFNVISGSSDPPTDLPDLKVDTDEYFGKLTSAPSPKFFLNASYRYRKATTKNAGICSTCAPSVGEDDFTKNEVLTAGATWFLTQNAFA
ncbi:MAG TPA: TonB-dependent receptor, partial [Thermoanaerobaculia bacterium]|nr:TonB-dependent receptor [Thermoanaerobaculia bacterium]